MGESMKIIYVKKLYILIVSLVIIFIASITLLSSKEKVISVNSTPVTNKRIIVDAGHGLPDQGTSSQSGVTEQKINLAISLKLQRLLEQSGATVILTRSDENGIYKLDAKSIREKKISDTNNRVEIGNNSNADIYVSIHLNYYQDGKYSGWQTFYQGSSEQSKILATIIQSELNNNFNKVNKRTPMQIKGVYIMDKVKIPTVIVECGFLSNAEEEKLLQQDSYQNDLAWGIYTGIQQFFYQFCE